MPHIPYIHFPTWLLTAAICFADEPADTTEVMPNGEAVEPASSGIAEDSDPAAQPLPAPLAKLVASAETMNPEGTLFLDRKKRCVLLRTHVACEDCLLEMLCCLEQTKEHESILAFRGKAIYVHAALVALGAKTGTPATFSPEFSPPTGEKIDIFVNWVDDGGKIQRADARSWMRHSVNRYYSHKLDAPPEGVKIPYLELRYDPYNKDILWFGPMSTAQRDELLSLCKDPKYQAAIKSFFRESQSKPMTAEFVFSGSFHYKRDEDSTQEHYAAEGGFLICVANFAQSTIDVREASSASDGGQSYEGWQGKVPPRGTPVILELVPASSIVAKSAPKPVK